MDAINLHGEQNKGCTVGDLVNFNVCFTMFFYLTYLLCVLLQMFILHSSGALLDGRTYLFS